MKKQKNTKCSFKKKNTVSYQKGGVVPKQRMGVRNNPDGTHSTHKMAYAESDGKWYAYPTLFQNADSSWVELNDDNNWEAFDEAARRGELQEFKTEKEAKDYAAGNWKTKQNGGAVNPIYTHDPNDPRLQAYNDSLRLYKSSTKERNDYLDFVKKAGFDDSKIGEWSTDGYINTDKHNNIGAIFNGILKNSGGGFDRNPNNFDDVRYFNYYPTKYNGDIKVYEDSPTGKKLMQGYEQYKKPVQPYIYEELTRLPMINKLPVNINVQIPKTKLEISKNEQSGMPVYDRTNRNKNKQKLVGYTDFVKDENTGKFKPVFIPRHPQNEDEIEYDLTDIQQQLGKNVEIRDEPKYNLNVRTLQQGGLVNNTGYTNGTPTANNPYNIIPSNNITMNNVDMPLLGVPNNGNPQVMLPENNYIFPNADYVTEIPLNNNNQMDNNKRLNSAPPPFQYGGTVSPYKRKTISYAQEGIEVPEHVSKARKVANIIKSVIPPITLNTAPIAGMMSAAVNYIDGLNTKRNELSNFRKNLTPVTSPNEFLGNNDMPMYYQVGGEITNNNINSNNEFSGYTSKDFNAPLNQSNVIAEDGEFIQFPDGSTTPIVGDSHSDPSGGEYLNLPENTKVFSEKLKADKDFSSEILNKKVNKKMSIADLAKKFNTDKEDKILNNTKTSSIEKQTASINKEKKIFKTNQIFEYQESLKQPQGNQLNFNNQPVFAQKGVKVLKGGYKGEGTEEDYNAGYSSQQVQDYMKFLQTEAIKRGYSGDLGDVSALQNLYFSELPEQVISNYFLETVPPTNQARRMYGLSGTPEEAQAQWKQQSPGTNEILKGVVDNIPGVRYPVVTTKEYDSLEELQEDINATGTPIYVPDGSEYPTIVKYNNADNQYLIPTLKKQSEGRIPYPSPRLDVNINSQRPTKPDLSPLTDLSKDKKGKDRFKKILKGAKDVFSGVSGMNDYLPEIIAAAQTLNKFPINVNKFQPKYISPQEMNIQAALNENYAQSQPLLQQQGFNPSVSNARTNQAAANLYGANNQMFQQKFNADAQNRQQVQQYNNQLENQANMMNLQRIDDFWNKMTQRQSNIEQDINNITNSAYRKSKQKQAERESIRLINQMMNNYNYSKGKGIQYDPETGQPITYNPNDLMQQMLMMQQQQELEKKRKAKEKEEKKKKAEGKD